LLRQGSANLVLEQPFNQWSQQHSATVNKLPQIISLFFESFYLPI